MNRETIQALTDRVVVSGEFVTDLLAEINTVMVGQAHLIERVLIALIADGHILLEGVPGLAKTLLIKTTARAIQAEFVRLQFTPDLLPADLLGTQIYNPQTNEFTIHKGPVFSNLVLADEINRAPAKVQSALLEAMQERQVTIGGTTYRMDALFLVLATQNPIEQEGTYPLPEAQVDRFLFKILVDYPTAEDELVIVNRMTGAPLPPVKPIIQPETLLEARQVAREIYVDERLKKYAIQIVQTTRKPTLHGLSELTPLISFGASPRASINLVIAARSHAFLQGRGFVTPEDIKQIAPDVLRHRVITSYEAEAEGVTSEEIVKRILGAVEVP